MTIKRNLESGDIYLNHWWSGVINNRSPLFTPISSFGIQMIQRMDALIDGLNMELSPKATLWRRYGYSKFCTQQFSSSNWPLTFYSFKNLAGTIAAIVDTPGVVSKFTGSAFTTIFSKSTTQQSSFITVGNFVYWCDGTSAEKWDGTHQWKWGIAAPVVTPGLSFGAGSLSPTSGYQYVYCYFNSTSGHLSTASPVSANSGPQNSKNITVSYTASGDGQVSNIKIFRTLDGGSLFYLLATVANTTTTYTDSTPDSGLNTFLVAPQSDANDPPPAGMSHVAFYAGRAWGAVGNTLYYAGGPDTLFGVGAEAWPPANNFLLPGAITCIRPMSAGLAVFTSDDLYILVGTDITSFTLLPWQTNFGVLSENAVAQDGDVLYVFTSRGMLYQMQYGGTLSEVGFNIRASLGSMTTSAVYIALHRNGSDEGLFVSDGTANIWRYGLDFGSWSPVAQPLQGCDAIGSIETSTGTWTLLMGISTGSSFVFQRDPTTFLDAGTAFSCFATVGNIVLAPPGQIAIVAELILQVTNGGAGFTYPTLSVLVNNVTGSFTTIPNPQGEPSELAGTAYESVNPLTKSHQWGNVATPLPSWVQNMQIKVAFTTDTTQSEILGVAVR